MNRSQLCRSCILMGILWIVFFPMIASGQLLVADRWGNQILEYNLDGIARSVFQEPIDTTLSTPAGMALGNGNDLYVTSLNTGEVLQYNWATGSYMRVFASGLNGPGGLLFDGASNTLHVSEFGGHQIFKYNATTREQIGVPLDAGAGVTGLANMALGPDGNLYVSSFWDGTVVRFNPISPTPEIFAGSPTPSIIGANGLVFDSSGNLDVVEMLPYDDHGNHLGGVIYQFDGSGTLVRELVPISGGGLNFPSDIVIDPDGNLLVSNMGDYTASGYIGKYNLTTGAAIKPRFITFSGPNLVQPSPMLIEPYAVWTGGAEETGWKSWKNAANWGGTAPVHPGAIRFGAVTGGNITNNDFATDTQFNGITFAAGSPQYTLYGNAIKLGGPVVNQSANDQEIDLDGMELVLGGGSFDTGNQKLTISGAISGNGSLTKKGSGTLTITGGLSYAGLTDIQEGTLQVNTGANTVLACITGAGTLEIDNTTTLSANSVSIGALVLGPGSTLVIDALPGGSAAGADLKSVPEPGTAALMVTAGLLAPFVFLTRRRKT